VFKRNQKGFVGLAALVVIALAIGGGAAYYFFTQVQTLESTPKPTDNALTGAKGEEGEKVVVDKKAKVESTTLKAVGSYEGSGKATRVFENGVFTHTVTANLDDPPEGKFYEGWLVTNDSHRDFFSTGKMIKSGSAYTLTHEANSNQSQYSQVVITEETEENGLDGIPEDHVLEGSF
jgi:hypothetical protein